MTGRLLSLLLAAGLTFAALWVFLTPQTMAELRLAFARANWPAMALATLLTVAVQWLRAWRFSIMTFGSLAFPGSELVRIAFRLNLFNYVLPFRLGELSYPVMMRRSFKQAILEASRILLVARLLDLCTVGAILLAAASWVGLPGWPAGVGITLGLALLLGAAPAAFLLIGRGARALIARHNLRAPSLGLATLPDRTDADTVHVATLAISFAVWLVFALLAWVAANAVADAALQPAVAMLGAAAGNLAFALPINGLAGLGPSQAAWVAAVTYAGVSWEDAVVTAFAVYAVTSCGAVLFGIAATVGWRSDG